jgi:glycosyltransferase involved in cell wall biosynthesis
MTSSQGKVICHLSSVIRHLSSVIRHLPPVIRHPSSSPLCVARSAQINDCLSAMKILYSYDTPMPDTGADTEQVVNNVAALSRHGHQMSMLLPGPVAGCADSAILKDYYHVSGDWALHLLQWRYHGARALEKWSFALRAPSHSATREAELVYTRNLPGAWAMLRAGRTVVYEHFRPWGDQIPALQPFLRAVLRHPRLRGAIFHSEHALSSYRRLGVPDARMLVAHNGWDPERMSPRVTQQEARARLGLPLTGFVAVYSGRMNLRKGLDVVLEVARRAPEISFILIGSEGEGAVEQQARALPNVRVVGWLKSRELPPWLYAADVLLIPPSLAPLQRHGNTVLPIKLFLYLAAGRAILAPRAPDTAELLRHSENSVLVEPGDTEATVSALRALAADQHRTAAIGAAAFATAADLTWDARAARITAFLLRHAESVDSHPDPWRATTWLTETVRSFLPFK